MNAHSLALPTPYDTSLSLLRYALCSCVGALFGARLIVYPFCLCTQSLADVDVADIAVLAKESRKQFKASGDI